MTDPMGARNWVISAQFGGERTYLRWVHIDSGRNYGRPEFGWGTDRAHALRMTRAGASGMTAILGIALRATVEDVMDVCGAKEKTP